MDLDLEIEVERERNIFLYVIQGFLLDDAEGRVEDLAVMRVLDLTIEREQIIYNKHIGSIDAVFRLLVAGGDYVDAIRDLLVSRRIKKYYTLCKVKKTFSRRI